MFSDTISFILPSLKTLDFVFTVDISLWITSDAVFSCQKPRDELIKIIANIIKASSLSPRKNDNNAVKTNIMIMGLLN